MQGSLRDIQNTSLAPARCLGRVAESLTLSIPLHQASLRLRIPPLDLDFHRSVGVAASENLLSATP